MGTKIGVRIPYPTVRGLWDYVPVPWPHVAGLLVGSALAARWPWRLTRRRTIARATGLGLVGCGVVLIGWTLGSVAGNIGSNDRELVTAGPYARSRNPMYVGWTMLYAGVALRVNNRWLALLFPAVAALTHVETVREERSLEEAFGAKYSAYRRRVRRYL